MRRPTGSSAEVGSSSRSTRGSPTSACAIPSRCCIPFDMPSTRRSRGIREGDELEQPLPLGGAAARAGEPLVQPEHLVRRVPPREAEELGEVAELGAGGAGAGARAGDLSAAARGTDEADGDLHERRLAGAVRAEQPDELALPHLEVDALQRLDGAVALREPVDGEGARPRRRAYGRTFGTCLAATWRAPPRRRPSAAPRRLARGTDEPPRPSCIRPSTAALRTIPSRTSSAGWARSTPTSCSRRGGLGRHGPPRRGRSDLMADLVPASVRRDELVDGERGQRLDPCRPRAPSATETRAIVAVSGASTTLTKSNSPSVAHWWSTFAPSSSTSRLTSCSRAGCS